MSQSEPIRVVGAGSRSFNDYPLFEMFMLGYNRKLETEHPGVPISFISGGARGPDQMLILFCKKWGYMCEVQEADWDRFGKSAGYRRNVQMCEACTHVIVFWDLISRGTRHMIDIAKKAGKPCFVVLVYPDEHVEGLNH